jgi:hypothetical protein
LRSSPRDPRGALGKPLKETDMTVLLMPKATAVWLVDNTSLSFEQIAEFCHLHPLEVKSIADGEVAVGIKGHDPILSGQLTREEIEKAEKDSGHSLRMAQGKVHLPEVKKKTKGPRYTPLSRRQDRPNAILWLLRNHGELKDAQISRLVGTTKSTIEAVRERNHWNSASLQPLDPVTLGLCSQIDLDMEVAKAAKDKSAPPQETGATLLPADVSAARAKAAETTERLPTFAPSAPKPAEERIDIDSVFAKLKELKPKE